MAAMNPSPMTRWKWIALSAVLITLVGIFIWGDTEEVSTPPPSETVTSRPPPPTPHVATASESLLKGYADPSTPPIDDLRKIHHVIGGYFSVIKDSSKNPIGGNADLSAALKGENPNREKFLPADHPVFSPDGLLIDRWGTPLVVHPEGWRQIGLRSAGPDKKPYTDDDLILLPTGLQPPRD